MRWSAPVAALVVVASVTAGCGSTTTAIDTAAAPQVKVVVANQMFTPMTVTVTLGSAVTWDFEDGGLPHDVIFAGFKSGAKTTGSFTHTFDKLGVYTYRCSIHPWMTGTVNVTAKATT